MDLRSFIANLIYKVRHPFPPRYEMQGGKAILQDTTQLYSVYSDTHTVVTFPKRCTADH